jgi:hypothetical protein
MDASVMAAGRVWHMSESAMRSKTFRPYDKDTFLPMPPSVRHWATSDSLLPVLGKLALAISDPRDEHGFGVFGRTSPEEVSR